MAFFKDETDTLLLSDVHIGWRYSRAEACLILLAAFVGQRLILLGDIFHFPKKGWDSPLARKFIERINQLAAAGVEVIFIRGNHDPRASVLRSLFPQVRIVTEYAWRSGTVCGYARHGHEFNGRNYHAWMIGDFLRDAPGWILHFIQRLEGRRHRLSRFLRRLTEMAFRLNEGIAAGLTDRIIEKQIDANAAFFSHSHLAESREIGNIRCFNTGSWVGYDDGELTYVVIDVHGQIETRRYAE